MCPGCECLGHLGAFLTLEERSLETFLPHVHESMAGIQSCRVAFSSFVKASETLLESYPVCGLCPEQAWMLTIPGHSSEHQVKKGQCPFQLVTHLPPWMALSCLEKASCGGPVPLTAP
jgi:hypothetical protein